MKNLKFYLVIAAVALVSVYVFNKFVGPKIGVTV